MSAHPYEGAIFLIRKIFYFPVKFIREIIWISENFFRDSCMYIWRRQNLRILSSHDRKSPISDALYIGGENIWISNQFGVKKRLDFRLSLKWKK